MIRTQVFRDTVQPRLFDINPAINPWLLFVGAVIAATAIVYLYSAQQKIARKAIVNSLMAIRICLVLLVIALLLGPVRQWIHTRHSNGSLFVLVDQSQSMRQKDSQSTDTEALHWADALGYLPQNLRPSPANVWVSRLIALQDDLDHFRSDTERLLAEQDNSRPRQELASHLDRWRTDLSAISTEMSSNSELTSDVPGVLRSAADSIGKSLVSIRSDDPGHLLLWLWSKICGAVAGIAVIACLVIRRDRFSSGILIALVPVLAIAAMTLAGCAVIQWPVVYEAAAENQPIAVVPDNVEIPWQVVHDNLGKAIKQVTEVARIADKDFLDSHGNDSRVRDAISKVRKLGRADLAYAALTENSGHGLKSLVEMMNREDVKLVPFGDHTSISAPGPGDLKLALRRVLKEPGGQNTDIAAALQFATEQAGEDSTVVVISDGRQNVGAEPEAPAKFLAARGTRVFTLTLGSHELARDAAVDHVDAPDWVYAEDQVVVSPVIRLDGLAGRDVTVELRRDNQVVDTRILHPKLQQEKLRLRLTDKPPKEGLYDYAVVIQPIADEAVTDNNRQSVRIAVKKDRLNAADRRRRTRLGIPVPAELPGPRSPSEIAGGAFQPGAYRRGAVAAGNRCFAATRRRKDRRAGLALHARAMVGIRHRHPRRCPTGKNSDRAAE